VQTFFDLSLLEYNNPTNVVWVEQPLHKVFNPKAFKPKALPKRTPFFATNLSIFLVYKNAIAGFFGVLTLLRCILQLLGLGLNESIYRLNGPHEIITPINLINYVHKSDVMGITRLIVRHKFDGLELHN